MKISAVYKITNTITKDFYIGSSKDVKQRLANHKCPSTWKNYPNKQLYQDMQKYGIDKFEFQILEEVESDFLKEKEQQFIEKLQPTYNNRRANGLDFEKIKECQKKYRQSEKGKEYQKEYWKEHWKEYHQSDKYKEYQKEYQQSDKYKECQKKYKKQLCLYNGEILTLNALSQRFIKAGIEHPTIEAKKYLLDKDL